ncbi:hypothetical protein KFL_011930015 [Klebsormidium nitens]|uniref:Uncharacterized protein n=1 Tax=Klebsormidium nitens TaxID=105231 RepID=A0A1Y1IQE9_KLENI|nr:hypothetical protein KFL_011930015 [Klebsormidium nitens]|eukprot:GAQ92903.1 hypothetical protein KFL_011930015 [Klebsormidium nitens]
MTDPLRLAFLLFDIRKVEDLEEDLSGSFERAAGSRRDGRRAMEEQVVADFFAERRQQREACEAREEETFGPISLPERHDRHDLDDQESGGAGAREQELQGRRSPATPAPDLARSQESEARTSTPGVQTTGRPASKKRRKKAKANPVPMDEAAREAGRAAAAAHLQAVGALRPSRTQREGQAVHQTELGDFEGPPPAPPLALVTDAPISNVGALVDRLKAKRDAEEAAAREERLKRYGRTRPLGAPRGTGDYASARALDQDPSPSSPLPSLVLPSQEEDPALSAAQPPTAAPSSLVAEDERAPPSPPPPADRPPVDEDPGSVSLSQPHEPPSHAGHPPSPPPADQPQEPLVIAPLPDENPRPEVVPGQPPAVALSPPSAHQE